MTRAHRPIHRSDPELGVFGRMDWGSPSPSGRRRITAATTTPIAAAGSRN